MSAVASIKDLFSSFMLTELFKGLALTGRHFPRSGTARRRPLGRRPKAVW